METFQVIVLDGDEGNSFVVIEAKQPLAVGQKLFWIDMFLWKIIFLKDL